MSDRYSTHLDILTQIYNYKKINTVMEFGMGMYSTDLFLKRTSGIVESIEMDTEDWFIELKNKFAGFSNWNPSLLLGKDAYLNHNFLERYDLAFSDGHPESRADCVNFIAKYCDTIVAHDTEVPSNKYDTVDLPDYFTFEDTRRDPYTKVWTKDIQLINHLKETIK